MDAVLALLRRVPVGPAIAVAAVLGFWGLSISEGATERVPHLVGLAADEARALASERGYSVRVEERAGPGAVGTVLAQEPPSDSFAARGSPIDIVITKGTRQVTVPDVRGMPVDVARRVLAEAGLAPGDVAYRLAPGKESNRVLESDPAPGTVVDASTRVEVVAAA